MPELQLADGARIVLGDTLRELPGKRVVYAGRLDGRGVVVKVYLDARRAPVHQRREAEGLTALHDAGIAAPALLYAGDDAAGRPLVVSAFIDGARDLASAWREADTAGRERLVGAMMDVLARHHAAGICQTDLHLANFLQRDDVIYTLDGAGVDARPAPLERAVALRNLALFCSQLPADWEARCVALAARYAEAGVGGDSDAATLTAQLPALIAQARAGRWRELSGKIYRECTAIVARADGTSRSYARRSYGAPLLALLDDIEASRPADRAELLKDGNTATVWRAPLGDRSVVVKRYNIKGPRHAVALALKESRASRSWRFAHLLQLYGITTPPPVALLYRGARRLGRVAYFVAEDVGDVNLRARVAQLDSDDPELHRLARQAARLLAGLKRLRIAHGDLKASNFLVSGEGLSLIDLDAMRQHRRQRGFAPAWRRDLARFDANWRDRPAVQAVMRDALRAAAAD